MDKATKESYRTRLLAIQARIQGQASRIAESVASAGHDPGDVSHLPTHLADNAAEGLDEGLAVLATEEELLSQLEEALARIDAGTYGVCQSCGKRVPAARLDALPFTPHCVQCSERQQAEQGE